MLSTATDYELEQMARIYLSTNFLTETESENMDLDLLEDEDPLLDYSPFDLNAPIVETEVFDYSLNEKDGIIDVTQYAHTTEELGLDLTFDDDCNGTLEKTRPVILDVTDNVVSEVHEVPQKFNEEFSWKQNGSNVLSDGRLVCYFIFYLKLSLQGPRNKSQIRVQGFVSLAL